jgi:hypothetical protein
LSCKLNEHIEEKASTLHGTIADIVAKVIFCYLLQSFDGIRELSCPLENDAFPDLDSLFVNAAPNILFASKMAVKARVSWIASRYHSPRY